MKKYRMSAKSMMSLLELENINTWFDLGLFIDRFKENNPVPTSKCDCTFDEFKYRILDSGIAFITFFYSIDGVTIEVEKYAKVFRKNFPKVPVHYIAGEFFPESDELIDPATKKYQINEMASFNKWSLYNDFFYTKLERGSKEYNDLILKFWKETLVITKKLANYIEKNRIRLLYLINTNSNPGNVSLSLATVLVSEFMGVPVINNSHDFYWEGGNRKIDIETKGIKPGPRDHFFLNADVGEFFSQIEVLFPWQSRSWMNVNINLGQSEYLINEKGHNPANVTEIGTAVDTQKYSNISKRSKVDAYCQFENVLSRYENRLISYSVNDVMLNHLVDKNAPRPILIGDKTKPVDSFLAENVIFLQPTRIISRKRIEIGFKLIEKLFLNKTIKEKLRAQKNLKLTILVTGPIANGHFQYFQKLLTRYSNLLESIDPEFCHQIYLAFLFAELDREDFKKQYENPVGIPELYNIASLILLPSKTEGRGLPIIEATACGTPIFCSRYFPEHVYSEVIGEHLPENDRLKVIEFDGKKVKTQHVDKIVEKVFFPHMHIDEINHNQDAVQKRFSLEALNENILAILYKLYLQIQPNDDSIQLVKEKLAEYKEKISFSNEDLKSLVKNDKRHYLPGYGRLAYMIYLKSLIDPSFFRVEEQNIRGYALEYAKSLIDDYPKKEKISAEKIIAYYNSVDNIFRYKDGETEIRHDHTFSYRHRNKNYYPYQDFTIQELTGLIMMLYYEIINPKKHKAVFQLTPFFTDWNLALSQLPSCKELGIDDRHILIKKMKTNLPIALFPGNYINYELEFFALQSVRSRLRLNLDQRITEELLDKNRNQIETVFLFTQRKSIGRWKSKKEVKKYIESGEEIELQLLYQYGILKIVNTRQICAGIHFNQLGEKALKVLRYVQNKKGYIISNRRFANLMTDIVSIDRFHIGQVTHDVSSNIMGIPKGSGFIQFAPASVRTTLAYPTPIQTAKDFSDTLKSKRFKNLCKKLGEDKVYEAIKIDAETNGSPINFVLDQLENPSKEKKAVEYKFVSGVYEDGLPWNGVMAEANVCGKDKWQFDIVSSEGTTKTVTTFVSELEKAKKVKTKIAWNGGYILNPELVGKLGLPETYIGSPLGLIISERKVICPPLFNKAALLINDDNTLEIKKVSCCGGISVTLDNIKTTFKKENYNKKLPGNDACYYDLMYAENSIQGNGRIIVRIAGNRIKEIIETKSGENIPVIPVGIVFSFVKGKLPKGFEIGKELHIELAGIGNPLHAVEAGPLLVEEGKFCLDMESEGWKTQNSIKTQAARLDYTDMRGPKIAAGIDKNGNLFVLTINGRIRESVGATHIDMAKIMMQFGMQSAMGFDPGGSSTLVVEGKTLNISPYNSSYEQNIFSLPPQPRAVSNAVIGYIEKS